MSTFSSIRSTRCWLVLGLASVAVLAGCRDASSAPGSDVAARIDGEPIPYSRFQTALRDTLGGLDGAADPVVSEVFDQLLDEELLIRLAIERGLEQGDGDPVRVDRRVAVRFLVERTPQPNWDADELRAYYEAHREDFARDEGVRLQQILTEDLESAEAARQALLDGEEVATVVARFSQVPNADLADGHLGREDLPLAFADEIFALDPGEVSEVFPAEYGYHVFRVLERHDAGVEPFAAVETAIRQALDVEHLNELVARFIDEARARYDVEVYSANLPFDYRGSYVQEIDP